MIKAFSEADSSGFRAPEMAFYLEPIAKTPMAPRESAPEGDEKAEGFDLEFRKDVHCGSWAWVRSCSEGHTFAKMIDCGREWCEKCRTSSHNRRMARWLSKAQKIKEMAYMVVTLPLGRRPRTLAELRRLGPAITGILKRRGFLRGLRDWHFMGDKSSRWNPHLNFLMEGGFLSKERLDDIKKAICGILKTEKIVLYYQYTESVPKMLHWIKYVTRPTFLRREWDEEMAEELHGFNRRGTWGTWIDEEKWALPEDEKKLACFKKVEGGICPACGKKLEGGYIVKVDGISEDLGWEKIRRSVWQYKGPYKGPPENVWRYRDLCKGPSENVLTYLLFKGFARGREKEAAVV